MNNSFTFTLTSRNYLSALRLNFWATVLSRKPLIFLGWVTVVYSIIIFTLYEYEDLTFSGILIGVAKGFGSALAVLCLCYGLGYSLMPSRSKKLFEQSKLLHGKARVEILPYGLVLTLPYSTTQLNYDMLYKWAANKDVLSLYMAENSFFVLPCPDMTDDQKAAIISGLQSANCPRFGPI